MYTDIDSNLISDWIMECDELAAYIFALKDDRGRYHRNSYRKTVIWGFAFRIQSVVSIAKDLLTQMTSHSNLYLHANYLKITLNFCSRN